MIPPRASRGYSRKGWLAQVLGCDRGAIARGRTLLAAIAAFENVPRLRSTHVGGFVLSSVALGHYLPDGTDGDGAHDRTV